MQSRSAVPQTMPQTPQVTPQATTQVTPQATRVQQLEQALDQALVCLAELRLRLQEQQQLEMQLADTERYASMQQQAIGRLKLQLNEQQQMLEMQQRETQQRDQAIQELLITIESMTQFQQQQGERLRSRLVQDQQEVQSHRSRLGKQLQGLQAVLALRQQRVVELEAETLASRRLSARLQQQLETAHRQIQGLVAQRQPVEPDWCGPELLPVNQQLVDQLLVDRLERQVAEMQEQILQQAQQEAEYETAVQYWKDRYFSIQPADKPEADLRPPGSPAVDLSTADRLPRLPGVELPDFLVRRQAGSKAALKPKPKPDPSVGIR